MQRRNPAIVRALVAIVLIAFFVIPNLAARKPAPSKTENAADGVAPKDAQWTLYCQAIGGPAHVEEAKAVKDKLAKIAPIKDWYVIHQENESVLYYGFYRTIDEKDSKDKKEGERAQRERKMIAGMQDQSGNKIFEHVYFVPVAAPDPVAPPEWNLLNASGYYTLQIAAYKDSPMRKQAAVEAVQKARAEGIDAYFYHGETTSSVCIGAWPKAAVAGEEDDADKGIVPDSKDPNETMLVLPQVTSDLDQLKVRDAHNGQRIKTYAPGLRPVDPSLIAMMEKYPTHAVNGVAYVTKHADGTQAEDPSVHRAHPAGEAVAAGPAGRAATGAGAIGAADGGGFGGGGRRETEVAGRPLKAWRPPRCGS
jgi:hypothetical protein